MTSLNELEAEVRQALDAEGGLPKHTAEESLGFCRQRIAQTVDAIEQAELDYPLTIWDLLSDDHSDNHELAGHLRPLDLHLVSLRAPIVRRLWAHGYFVGVTVIDELLILALQQDEEDPLTWMLQRIFSYGPQRPGLIVLPLTGFGIKGVGLLKDSADRQLPAREAGMVVAAQTGSVAGAIEAITSAAQDLGVEALLPADLIEHWSRSRPIDWLTENPLLIVRAHALPGEFFEIEATIVASMEAAISAILIVQSMAPDDDGASPSFSTSRVNNFETRDIRHFAVLYDPPVSDDPLRELEGQLIPLRDFGSRSGELVHLPIDIGRDLFETASAELTNLSKLLVRLHAQVVDPTAWGREEARVGNKMWQSLTYFHRSFIPAPSQWRETVSLAIAVETLLTDRYEAGVKRRVARRVKNLLATSLPDGARRGELETAVDELFAARGALVHGDPFRPVADLSDCQEAFARCFTELGKRLPEDWSDLPYNDGLTTLCGDTTQGPSQRVDEGS